VELAARGSSVNLRNTRENRPRWGTIIIDDLSSRIGTILRGIASGLFPMAAFTPIYAIWPLLAWPIAGTAFFVVAAGWSAVLAMTAVRLIRLSRELPCERNADDARISTGMAIVGSIQGGLILTSAAILALSGYWIWILPVIALIVALHFFAMPWIFHRTIDFSLGAAMLVVAVIGLVLAGQPDISWQTTWAIVGVGGTLVTSGYGLWMRRTAARALREYAASLVVA
jgi:hypothetical protein